MKSSNEIVKWGRIKPFFDKFYKFNTIDIETVDNELFLIGMIIENQYTYTQDDFFTYLNKLFVRSVQENRDILSWSRYDNTHIIKCLIERLSDDQKRDVLQRVGKVTPLFTYQYRTFEMEVTNVIKENIIITIKDVEGKKKRLTLYNLKNLFDSDLETSAKDYHIDYYTKLGVEYHIIDKERYETDLAYKQGVLKSNELDNRVLLDLASKLLENFKAIAGVYPKTMFTAGSLARSYLLTVKGINFNFRSLIGKDHPLFNKLLDKSMRSYHGGKIESYVLGRIENAEIIDITSAYPFQLSRLPQLTNEVVEGVSEKELKKYFYAFIDCTIHVEDDTFIHPITIPSPMNKTNISPSGTFKATITKPEYDYLKSKGVRVDIESFIAVKHKNRYPYKKMIEHLFNQRMETKVSNKSMSGLYKLILNSLYGITFELTDSYAEFMSNIEWEGYRAGDFFNPVIASYITGMTRTYLSEVSQNIVENGGEIYLNMTDSIIYKGKVTLDVFSEVKTLGKFDKPQKIGKVMILGAGRYEYYDEFKKNYTIKSRGFNVKIKNESYYTKLDLRDDVSIVHKAFVSFFKATTKKYTLDQLGHLIDEDYVINPLNLGGKRIIEDMNVNLQKSYTKTRPVRL